MDDRRFFSENLWDWLAEGPAFEQHDRMEALRAGNPDCALEHREAVALRAGLKAGAVSAPQGFEARLKARLEQTLAAEPVPGTVVTPPASLWRRGPLLVLAGVAAVMAFALVGSWQAEQAARPGSVASVETVAPAPEPAAESATASTGLLAEREFHNDRDTLSADSTRRTDVGDELQPVSSRPRSGR